MKARAAAQAASASGSSEAAAGLRDPLWLRPAPVAEETEPGLSSGSEEVALQEQPEASGKGKGKDPTIIRDHEQAEAYGKGEGSTSRSATTSQANVRGPGLSSGPQNEPDSPVEHQLPAFHELRRLRAGVQTLTRTP